MDSLPIEILERILAYLPLQSQIRCEGVCKKWRKMLRNFWTMYDRNTLIVSRCDIKISDHCPEDGSASVETAVTYFNKENLRSILSSIFHRGGRLFKTVKIEYTTVVDMELLDFIGAYCPNVENLHTVDMLTMFDERDPNSAQPSLQRLVSAPNLKHLTLKSNLAVQVDSTDWSHCRQWSIGNVCPAVFLFPVGLDAMTSSLTKLHLEEVLIASRVFQALCARLGHTLQCFCLKMSECTMQRNAVEAGLCELIQLRHLNVSSPGRSPRPRSVAAMLNDGMLENIGNRLTQLEYLSIRGAVHVSSAGINLLLNSTCGLSTLKFLNLNCCRQINFLLAAGMKTRSRSLEQQRIAGQGLPGSAPLLVIYAYLTALEEKWASMLSDNYCKVCLIPSEMDESLCFGDEKMISLPHSNDIEPQQQQQQDNVVAYNQENAGGAGLVEVHVNPDDLFNDSDWSSDSE